MLEGPQGLNHNEFRLYSMLREYRNQEAEDRRISQHRIFHDKTLRHLVEVIPRYPEDLPGIYRFGPKTIGAHGKAILRLIDNWADEIWGSKEQVGTHSFSFDATVFESTLGNSSWTKILSQLYLSFSHGRPRVTSKDLVERSGCSEETVRRTLVEMEETGMILRGGRGEGHTLNWKLPRIENLIFSLAKIEAKEKEVDILHVIRYLKVKDSKHRGDEIESGLLKLMNGDPALLDGFLENRTGAMLWAEDRLVGILGEAGLDYSSRTVLHPIAEAGRRGMRLRPDATVRLPEGELLCIEAHLPLKRYRESIEEKMPRKFFSQLKYEIRSMGSKYVVNQKEKDKREEMDEGYIPEYEKYGTADYCIIFIPSGEIFSYISSNRPDILESSIQEHRVFLTSPSTLLSTIKFLELASQGSEADHHEEFRKALVEIRENSQYMLESIRRTAMEIKSETAQIEGSIGQKLEAILNVEMHTLEARQFANIDALEGLDTRMAAQKYQTIVLQALAILHEKKKSKYVPRSELRAEAKTLGLERSNSRFSQILSSLEEDGLIARKSLGDVELGSIGVALKPKSQYENYIPNYWKLRIAELFDDEGKLHFES